MPKLLHITEPDQERQPGNESADTPDHAIADGLEQLALGGDASTDSKDAAVKSGKESTQQLPRQQEGAFQGLAPDLDFDEFLQRQKTFVEVCHFLSAFGISTCAQYMSEIIFLQANSLYPAVCHWHYSAIEVCLRHSVLTLCC